MKEIFFLLTIGYSIIISFESKIENPDIISQIKKDNRKINLLNTIVQKIKDKVKDTIQNTGLNNYQSGTIDQNTNTNTNTDANTNTNISENQAEIIITMSFNKSKTIGSFYSNFNYMKSSRQYVELFSDNFSYFKTRRLS